MASKNMIQGLITSCQHNGPKVVYPFRYALKREKQKFKKERELRKIEEQKERLVRLSNGVTLKLNEKPNLPEKLNTLKEKYDISKT